MSLEEDDIWHTYAMDAVDALREIEQSLLVLESDPQSKGVLNRLYRALHTLKGNSALLELTRIESLAHAAEDMIGHVRDHGVEIDQGLIDLMLKLIDRLREVTEFASAEHRDVPEGKVLDLVEGVRQWGRERGLLHEDKVEGASRGQILVWSDLPSATGERNVSSDELPPSEDAASVELFLALCREQLPQLQRAIHGLPRAGVEPGLSSGVAGAELAALALDLAASAERMGYAALVDSLRSLARAQDTERAQQAFLTACNGLVAVEESFRLLAGTKQGFGMADAQREARSRLSIRAARASVRGRSLRPGSMRPSLRASRVADPHEAPSQAAGKVEFLRIDARKVSLIMDLAGEIALASGAVTHHPDLEGQELEGFSSASHKLEVLIRELQNEVSAMRLVPVAGVFQRMKRVVRDTARRTGKRVELVLMGEDTEIDKIMVDCLQDPLVHLLRNAVDHGIETADERASAGKPPVGRIVLEASHQGGEVSVQVSDDGRGLNRQKVIARAVERGLASEGERLTEEQIVSLVFTPGFSTKEQIDELSGRGVGMDVIKTTIEGLRGRVSFQSTEGVGSKLTMSVPLTLAFVEAMVVRARERLFALPIEKVFEVFKVERNQLSRSSADGQTVIRVREHLIPVMWLHRFYGEQDDGPLEIEGRVVVVVQTSRGSLALPVDALLGNQPVMLKPLRGALARVRAAAGCGMLRSGDVALALDCERLHA